MKKLVLGLVFFVALSNAHAALRPKDQLLRDLENINELLINSVRGMNTPMVNLQMINYKNGDYIYNFQVGQKSLNCIMVFKRAQINRPAGWVGPKENYQIFKNTCIKF